MAGEARRAHQEIDRHQMTVQHQTMDQRQTTVQHQMKEYLNSTAARAKVGTMMFVVVVSAVVVVAFVFLAQLIFESSHVLGRTMDSVRSYIVDNGLEHTGYSGSAELYIAGSCSALCAPKASSC